jgi:hypothetical protein
MSRALVVEKEIILNGKTAKQHFPVYFVSEILTRSKRFYSEVEIFCYVVIMSAHKFRHYFKAHTIRVLTDQPLHGIFRNMDSSRRISKWEMELSEYVVDFEKRSAIKSQVLADFVAEWTEPGSATVGEALEEPWLVHCDRAWGAAAGNVLRLLVQVLSLLQHDDDKEGGIEHGGVLGVAIAVLKL